MENTTLKALEEKRGAALKTMEEIGEALKKEGRSMTTEEKEKFDKADKDFEEANSTFRALKRTDEANASIQENIEQRAENQKMNKDQRKEADELELRAWHNFLRKGERGMKPEERTALLEAQNRGRAPEMRTMNLTDTAAFVPEGFIYRISEALKLYGGVREVAEVIATESGNDLPWPCVDDTGISGELVTEGGTNSTSGADPTFGSVTLEAYKWGSRIVKASTEIVQDSAFDLESFLIKQFAIRIGRIENSYFTTGTGTSQPKGIVTCASGSGVTDCAVSSFGYEDMLNLFHAVDPLYRLGAKWMMNDATLKLIKNLSIGTNYTLPLWQPNIALGEPDTIMGKPYQINQNMASVGASNIPLIFGDFSYYKVRDVKKGTMLTIFRELYMADGYFGFLLNTRSDGRMASIGTPFKKLTCASS